MRTGVFILPDQPWVEAAPKYRRAEELGFDHAWTFDHLVWGGLPNAQWFSCIPTLTAAAAVTTSIDLGALVISPNFRHPVSLAREIQTLIDISGGRFLAGLGAGGTPDDGILGQEPLTAKQKVDRFQEFTLLLDDTLRDDHVSSDGEYYQARDMRLVGGSVRDRVPRILAGNGPRSVRFAAAHGDAWVTTGKNFDDLDDWFADLASTNAVLDAALETRGSTTEFRRYLGLTNCPVNPLDSLNLYDEIAGRASEVGFTDIVVSWPRDGELYHGSEATVEAIAAQRLTT